MTDHVTTPQMERFCARALGVAELATIARHLAWCRICHQLFRETSAQRRNYAPVSFSLAPEQWLQHEHLEYEQLAPYVENRIDITEREIIDLHLQFCGQCREDLRSFQVFRQQTGSELADLSVSATQATWSDKLYSGWNWLRGGWKPIYASMIVVALISAVILIAWLQERNKRGDLQSRQSQSKPASGIITTPSVKPSNLPTPENSNNGVATAVRPDANSNQQKKVEDSVLPQTTLSSNRMPKVRSQLRPSVNEVVALNDGQERVTIDNSGHLTGLDNLPPETQATIKGVLLAQNIERPRSLSEIMGETSPLRGVANEGQSFKLLSPARTVIANDRPTFIWTPMIGATSYRVQVVNSHNHEVANSGELSPNLTTWTLTKPLARGVVYTWVVSAVVNGQEVIAPSASEPEMKFKVLDEETLQEINILQQHTHPHLALGILYARAGMRAEAELEFQKLVKQNPNSSVAQNLLHSVQSWQ